MKNSRYIFRHNRAFSKSHTAKRLSALLAAAALTVGSFPCGVWALPSETESLASTSDESAYPADAVVLYTAEDLISFAKNCSLDSYSVGKQVYLAGNIDLSASDFTGIPYFAGEFNGSGFAVTGLHLDGAGNSYAFFRTVAEGAVIRNLTVRGSVAPSGTATTVGGIAARNAGTIFSCYFNGSVHGKNTVGGIAGLNEASGQIVNCAAWGSIGGEYRTGGIVGQNLGSVTASTNYAQVNTIEVEVTFDISDFDLRTFSDTDRYVTCTDTGGIAGHSSGVLQNCINRANVGYPHTGYNVGGIAGRQSGYMDSCVNYGSVYGRKEVAGIVGQAEPFVSVSYDQSVLSRFFDECDKLSDLLDQTVEHNTSLPTDISDQLDAIDAGVSAAKDNAGKLVDLSTEWGDASIDTVNDIFARISLAVDGVSPAVTDIRGSMNDLANACTYLDSALKNGKDGIHVLTSSTALEEALGDLKSASTDAGTALADISTALDHIKKALGDTDAVYEAFGDITDALQALSTAIDKISASAAGITSLMEPPTLDDLFPDGTIGSFDLSYITGNFRDLKKEFEKLSKNMGKAADAVSLFLEATSTVTDEFDPREIKTSLTLLETAFTTLSGISDDLGEAFDSINTFLGEMKEAGGYLADATEDLRDVTAQFESAFRGFERAAERMSDTANELSAMPDIVFPKIGSNISDISYDIRENLSGIQENFSQLNSTVTDASDTFLNDLRAINAQIRNMMSVLREASDDAAADKSIDDIYEDISENDRENNQTTGKINRCVNRGTVEGDVNVGGIAGAMSIESDFDPEDDLETIGKRSADFIYRTRIVLRSSENHGEIIAKKNGVGGIVGRMDIGAVIDCTAYGSVTSQSGDYAGGIAGISYTSIRDSRAKCMLSGRRYIGGIAGMAHDMKNCISVPAILEAEEYIGAIAGNADGTLTENRFVSDTYAGIDGISYAGKAEPITYDALGDFAAVSDEFISNTLIFRVDGLTVAKLPFIYGEPLPPNTVLPPLPAKAGYEARWDYNGEPLTYGRIVEAVYTPYVTALEAVPVSEDNASHAPPAVLLDGEFGTEASAAASAYTAKLHESDAEETEIYRITLSGTEDETTYRVRFRTPETPKRFKLLVKNGERFEERDFETDGSYTVFAASGNEVCFTLVPDSGKAVIIACAAGLAAIVILVVILLCRKRKKRKAAKKKATKSK